MIVLYFIQITFMGIYIMKTRKHVLEILNREKFFLKERFHVKRMAIFGSFAKGIPTKNSDIDIFVEFDKPVGFQFIEMSDYLDKKLGLKTDILTPGGVKSIRRKSVSRNIKQSLMYV